VEERSTHADQTSNNLLSPNHKCTVETRKKRLLVFEDIEHPVLKVVSKRWGAELAMDDRLPEATRRVRSGKGVSPSPVRVGSGEGALPPPQKFF